MAEKIKEITHLPDDFKGIYKLLSEKIAADYKNMLQDIMRETKIAEILE